MPKTNLYNPARSTSCPDLSTWSGKHTTKKSSKSIRDDMDLSLFESTSPSTVTPKVKLSHGPMNEQSLTPSSAGKSLMSSLQKGIVPAYAHALVGDLPKVPSTLLEFCEVALDSGLDRANEAFYSDDVVDVPKSLQKYMSGTSHKALQFEDEGVQEYFAALFHHIKDSAQHTSVELTGWDLYHGHLFGYSDSINPKKRDLGMLFHAKEHPTDMPIHFGQPDPRVGSQCCSRDADFHLRNYLWLASTNEVILLDPKHKDFPKNLINPAQKQFATVDEAAFMTLNLGSVNYFPESGESLEGEGNRVWVGANQGFPADLQIKDAKSDLEIKAIISRLELDDLAQLLTILDGGSTSKRLRRIPEKKRLLVREAVKSALQTIEDKRQKNIRLGMENLLNKGYPVGDAFKALLKTQVGDYAFSTFRAECILQVMAQGYDVDTAAIALKKVDEMGQDVEKALEWLSELELLD